MLADVWAALWLILLVMAMLAVIALFAAGLAWVLLRVLGRFNGKGMRDQ